MARYKPYDLNQAKLIPLSYADQVVEGSFEHALNEIVEEHLDLSAFEKRYANDETGRPAYDPRILLKVVLYGYYKGIISSRALAEACRRNVVFMALSADTRPHFTTLASFVSELDREIVGLFRDVLLYASELGLVGKEHFAVDGCKLPSNASKRWSGTHRELKEKREKLERVAERIVARHRERDGQEKDGESAKDAKKVEQYRRKVNQIKAFLEQGKRKEGPTGNEQKSNITDPESAKMTSSRGVIQGYNGLAVVDDRAQIVVHAEARGSGYEAHLLAQHLLAQRRQVVRQVSAPGAARQEVREVVALRDEERRRLLQAAHARGAEGLTHHLQVDDGAGEHIAHVVQHVGGHLRHAHLARGVHQPRLGLLEFARALLHPPLQLLIGPAQLRPGALHVRVQPRVVDGDGRLRGDVSQERQARRTEGIGGQVVL